MTPEWKKLREWIIENELTALNEFGRGWRNAASCILNKMDEIEAEGKQSQETNETIIPRNS